MPENTVPSAPLPPTTLSLGLTNAAGLPYIFHHIFSVLQQLQTSYLVSPFSQCDIAHATSYNSQASAIKQSISQLSQYTDW